MKLQKYFELFKTSLNGLSENQVIENQKKFGTNKIVSKKRKSFIGILLFQLGGFFSIVLFCAAGILFFLGDLIDFYIILVVIILNSTIESIQMYRSDSIFESLTEITPFFSIVIRNGKKIKIESSKVAVGDIVLLQSGERIPADGIVIFEENFNVNESILTGESESVSKTSTDDYESRSIIDSPNSVFSGTFVTTGTAQILITEVGNKTQIGLIAQKIETIDTQLPLYKDIKNLSFGIFLIVLFFVLLIFVIGVTQNNSWIEILKVAVALLVSAIPESLPVMITLILAYGFKRMSDKNVLVRKMQSLDVLGKIGILALDKTGTITHNQMKVEKVFTFNEQEIYVSGNGYEPKGQSIFKEKNIDISDFSDLNTLIKTAVLSSDGSYYYDQVKKDWMLETGDPTEVSLLVLGEKNNITKEILKDEYIFEENIPFTNQKMYHSAIYKHGSKKIVFYTGAPEIIYKMCGHVLVDGSHKKINENYRNLFYKKIKEYSSQGYRILASCVEQDKKIICLGIFAISDSIRSDVSQSIQEVYKRGIDIIMITGDHKDIALKVAQKIGINCDASSVLTGDDISNLTDKQIKNIILQKKIFARVTPQQKLKILELLKQLGKKVAMTGDGVNDALALVRADIGISMGTISSDFAKEVSDIILLDNKFGSIVYGVDEGKNIFSNIKKTILFLLSTNFAEMFVVVFAVLLILPLPVSAIGILWLNLVTDTFLVIGFAVERNSKDDKNINKIFHKKDWYKIIYLGLIMTLISLIIFMNTYTNDLVYAQSITLLSIIIMQWFNVLNIRSGEESVFLYRSQFNWILFVGMLVSFVLTIVAFNTEFLRNILQIHPINLNDWVYIVIISSSILWLEEIRKVAQKTKLFLRK